MNDYFCFNMEENYLGIRVSKETGLNVNSFLNNKPQIMYVINGTAEISFSNKEVFGNDPNIIRTGEGILLLSDYIVQFREDKNCVYRTIIMTEEYMERACNYISESMMDDLRSENKIIKFQLSLDSLNFFEMYFAKFINTNSITAQEKLSRGIMSCLLSYIDNEKEKTPYNEYPLPIKQMIDILNYIPNIKNGIPDEIYSLGYSRSYLCKYFKKYVGMSMTDYILDMKLKHSVTLLCRNSMTIYEICQEIGIESTSFFNKIFKRKYGMSPSKFKAGLLNK